MQNSGKGRSGHAPERRKYVTDLEIPKKAAKPPKKSEKKKNPTKQHIAVALWG